MSLMPGFVLLIAILLFLLLRFCFLVYPIIKGKTKYSKSKRKEPVRTLICVGSGGHTTEIIKLVSSLNVKNYSPRYYVMAQTDIVSEQKINELEKVFENSNFEVIKIPRSRYVGQSYFSSIFSTLYSVFYCVPIVLRTNPELILCNGPGTCIPVCFIAFLLKLFFVCDNRIVFIESICRVKSFSLTGKILMYFADNIVVHWKDLEKMCSRADYIGRLF